MPAKRCDQTIVCYLDPGETDALLAAPDCATWIGRRDHALLLVAVEAGLRVSEITGLVCGDLHLGVGAHVRCQGKGRKHRATPLTAQTVDTLQVWLRERSGDPHDSLFPSRRGGPLSSDAVAWLTTKYATAAGHDGSSISATHVTPHVLRHTAAMNLLQSGVDVSVIALWLGHFSGVGNLSLGVAGRTCVRGWCDTLYVLCVMCMSVSHTGGPDAVAEGRVDAGVGVLDCRRRRLAPSRDRGRVLASSSSRSRPGRGNHEGVCRRLGVVPSASPACCDRSAAESFTSARSHGASWRT